MDALQQFFFSNSAPGYNSDILLKSVEFNKIIELQHFE